MQIEVQINSQHKQLHTNTQIQKHTFFGLAWACEANDTRNSDIVCSCCCYWNLNQSHRVKMDEIATDHFAPLNRASVTITNYSLHSPQIHYKFWSKRKMWKCTFTVETSLTMRCLLRNRLKLNRQRFYLKFVIWVIKHNCFMVFEHVCP